MPQTHLWVEELVEANGTTTASAAIEIPNQRRTNLWYRVPSEYGSLLTRSGDPFAVAMLLMSMFQGTDLVVHGEVSPSLLQNLTEFQLAWSRWRPEKYKQIEIIADVEREQQKAGTGKAISTFSGGVDSCFTVLQHRKANGGKIQRNLQAGLMVHGFDIPLEQKEIFDSAAAKSRKLLDSLNVELVPMATNFKEDIKLNWQDSVAIAMASCMMILQNGYEQGLIASTFPYQALVLPLGSNPLTDRLLSSNSFQIVHDGASHSRVEKIRELGNWKEALQDLRVCGQGQLLDRNCGRCEKCIRTILGFRVMGIGLPECFERDATDDQITGIKGLKGAQLADLDEVLKAAKTKDIHASWVTALEKCLRRHHYRAAVKNTLRRVKLVRQIKQMIDSNNSELKTVVK
jgi:hypothetical protein